MLKLFALVGLLGLAAAIPVDNGVEGDPEIECGPTSITVNFNTQKAFEGHVYVKGLYDQAGCRNDEGGRQVAGIELPFDTCNVARTRSLNPKGVFVTTTVIVSFHPKFETKVDRAYRIQCFYMEADKTVSAELEVSMLTTGFQTQVVPMPICRYEILTGGPTGTPVQYALIGDSVYHKWTCDTETVDTFCMVVHSCEVDDGNGDKVELLTAEGCAVDKFLLNNLEYPTDLMAGQEAHVFNAKSPSPSRSQTLSAHDQRAQRQKVSALPLRHPQRERQQEAQQQEERRLEVQQQEARLQQPEVLQLAHQQQRPPPLLQQLRLAVASDSDNCFDW
uniref:ZP domain-containing protein n=1 Tax=Plectus sambesii TaxID=2011161 RepID=A0A914UL02_9BILA